VGLPAAEITVINVSSFSVACKRATDIRRGRRWCVFARRVLQPCRERERERDQIVPTGSVCLSCEISDGGTNGEFDEECFDRRIKRFFDTMNQQKKIVRLSSSTRVSTVQDVDA